jgi:hypothetical protein
LTERFKQCLPKTVFGVLGDHASMDEARLRGIVEVFDTVLSRWLNVTTSVQFLQVGIAHFKQRDTRALLTPARSGTPSARCSASKTPAPRGGPLSAG